MKCPECQKPIPDSSSFCSACGAHLYPSNLHTKTRATEPIFYLEPGQTFGKRFTVVEKVGVGGMGFVYKAVDRKAHQAVALKLSLVNINPDGI